MKKIIISIGAITTILASTASIISCDAILEKPDIEKPKNGKNAKLFFNQDIYQENRSLSSKNNSAVYKSIKKDIVDAANEADINLFFTAAVAPFTNLLRLSLLDKTENHFFIIKDNKGEGFEDKVNVSELDSFYNHGRVGVKNTSSSAIGISGSNKKATIASINAMRKIITKNPNKKINVWTNALHIDYGDSTHNFFDLLGFKNVNIQLVEDGTTNFGYLRNKMKHILKKSDWVKDNLSSAQKLVSPMYIHDTVRSWWSNPDAVKMNQYDNKDNKNPFQYFAYKELSDGIFNTRDVNGKRLMSTWPAVSGLNWEDAANIVLDAKQKNGLPSLIVLGSYGVSNEEPWIKDIWAKYHSKYNIFYKGHPGHMDHPLFVTNWINYDKPENMYQLEPMISSEELTRDHVVPASGPADGEKYIQFDKVAVVNHSSAVSVSAFPNLDITKDVIEVYDGKTEFVNPSEDPTSTNWQPQADWLKSL